MHRERFYTLAASCPDRTGIIAFLVLALAGVSLKDITADYELSVDSVRDQLLAERNTSAYEVLLKTLEGINLENYLLEGGMTQIVSPPVASRPVAESNRGPFHSWVRSV